MTEEAKTDFKKKVEAKGHANVGLEEDAAKAIDNSTGTTKRNDESKIPKEVIHREGPAAACTGPVERKVTRTQATTKPGLDMRSCAGWFNLRTDGI